MTNIMCGSKTATELFGFTPNAPKTLAEIAAETAAKRGARTDTSKPTPEDLHYACLCATLGRPMTPFHQRAYKRLHKIG